MKWTQLFQFIEQTSVRWDIPDYKDGDITLPQGAMCLTHNTMFIFRSEPCDLCWKEFFPDLELEEDYE